MGDNYYIWPAAGLEENTWRPWDTWPRGCKEEPLGKQKPSIKKENEGLRKQALKLPVLMS